MTSERVFQFVGQFLDCKEPDVDMPCLFCGLLQSNGICVGFVVFTRMVGGGFSCLSPDSDNANPMCFAIFLLTLLQLSAVSDWVMDLCATAPPSS